MANYNSTLQTNNTDLQAILNKVNALPEAGGNVSVEWKNVFELPTTYIVTHESVQYYIEIPEIFNILVVRVFVNNSWYYNIFSIRDGINILNNNNNNDGTILLDHINDGILGIKFMTTNKVPVATFAEYIII